MALTELPLKTPCSLFFSLPLFRNTKHVSWLSWKTAAQLSWGECDTTPTVVLHDFKLPHKDNCFWRYSINTWQVPDEHIAVVSGEGSSCMMLCMLFQGTGASRVKSRLQNRFKGRSRYDEGDQDPPWF